MVNNIPKQPQNTDKNKNFESFSNAVKHYMKIKGMTQSDLRNSSLLSKTTVSRIIRNSNDKGSSYSPTVSVVMAVSVGLQLTCEESKELFFSAFPEMPFMREILDKHKSIDEANEILYDNGAPLLGNTKEE